MRAAQYRIDRIAGAEGFAGLMWKLDKPDVRLAEALKDVFLIWWELIGHAALLSTVISAKGIKRHSAPLMERMFAVFVVL